MPSFAGIPTSGPSATTACRAATDQDAARVLLAATDLRGEASTTSTWFRREHLSAFNGKTSEQLVHEDRTDDVLAYLQSLEADVAG